MADADGMHVYLALCLSGCGGQRPLIGHSARPHFTFTCATRTTRAKCRIHLRTLRPSVRSRIADDCTLHSPNSFQNALSPHQDPGNSLSEITIHIMSLTFKLLSLAIRTAAKPIGNYIKRQAKEHEAFRRFAVNQAQRVHRIDMRMVCRFCPGLRSLAYNRLPNTSVSALQVPGSMWSNLL